MYCMRIDWIIYCTVLTVLLNFKIILIKMILRLCLKINCISEIVLDVIF